MPKKVMKKLLFKRFSLAERDLAFMCRVRNEGMMMATLELVSFSRLGNHAVK